MSKIDFSSYAPQAMFLLQGDEDTFDQVLGELSQTDPLVQALSVPRFTIDHARSVAEFAQEGMGHKRMYVVFFSVFSPEAAQVLLKSLEEPAEGTSIIFITRYPYLVPQTVRSRLMLLKTDHRDMEKQTTKKILEDIKKEASEKDDDAALRRSRATILLDRLEEATKRNHYHTDTIYRAKGMLFKANMPTKYILDFVSTLVRS